MFESYMLFLCRILFAVVIYAQKGQYVKITRIISNSVCNPRLYHGLYSMFRRHSRRVMLFTAAAQFSGTSIGFRPL